MTLRIRPSVEVTVSSKRQITLPAGMVRETGIEPGDKLVAILQDDGTIRLKKRPASLIELLKTFPKGTYGRTKEEIDANLAQLRSEWDREYDDDEDGS